MTKTGHFLRGFTGRVFSSRFSWPFKDFQDSTPKESCPCISRIFTGKAMHFNGLISKLVVLLIKEEMHRSYCSAALRLNGEKKITTRGLFINAMSHVNLMTETRVYICHKNMKSMGFFTTFRKYLRKFLLKKFYRK